MIHVSVDHERNEENRAACEKAGAVGHVTQKSLTFITSLFAPEKHRKKTEEYHKCDEQQKLHTHRHPIWIENTKRKRDEHKNEKGLYEECLEEFF